MENSTIQSADVCQNGGELSTREIPFYSDFLSDEIEMKQEWRQG